MLSKLTAFLGKWGQALLKWLVIFGLGYFAGRSDGWKLCDAGWQEKQRVAEQAARDKEIMWQGVVNGTVKNYEVKVAGIRSRLGIALDSLRDWPGRTDRMSAPAGTARACATGAELCREDGAFLAREAARADEIRAGLVSGYEVIDKVR